MSKKRDFQDLPRWCSKTELKILAGFGFKQSWDLPDVQYYCGILFRYQKKYPESLEYDRPLYMCYGRPLFQKVPKILPKNGKKSLLGYTFWDKMLLRVGATSKKKCRKWILYAWTSFGYEGYPPEWFPAEIMGLAVAIWNLVYEQKPNFHIFCLTKLK